MSNTARGSSFAFLLSTETEARMRLPQTVTLGSVHIDRWVGTMKQRRAGFNRPLLLRALSSSGPS
eukprot:2353138-Alexandrium_andersonii.AAC.1